MAAGFGRPNGVSFSNDERAVNVPDTDAVHGGWKSFQELRQCKSCILFTINPTGID
jgi:hypothetical protein